MRRLKKLPLIILTVLIIVAFSTGAIAGLAYRKEKIDVVYKNIKIFVNEKLFSNNTKPFILSEKGVTMVSLRDICEELGADVYWDYESNSVYINHTKAEENLSKNKIQTVKLENIKVLRNIGPFYEKNEDIMIAGKHYTSGIEVEVNKDNNTAEVVLDLNKHFATLKGSYGIEDNTSNSSGSSKIKIYGDGILLFQTDTIQPASYPGWISPGKIDLKNINLLKILVEWEKTENPGQYEKVITALVNFKLLKK